MSLVLEKSYIVQQDLITVGSIVFIRGGSIEYRLKLSIKIARLHG